MKKKNLALMSTLLLLAMSTGGLATSANAAEDPFKDDETVKEAVYDPLEPINRATFAVNDVVYNAVIFPVNDLYRFVMPNMLQTGISNFFHNLTTPIRLVGDLMQGKGEKAKHDTLACVSNTMLGLGFFTIYEGEVKKVGDDENVSQGLASWGIPSGPYIVWPLFGPSNPRNTVGSIGDAFLMPHSYVESPDNIYIESGRQFNELSLSNQYRDITEGAVDKYDAIKDAYYSNFDKRLKQ